MGFKVSVLNLDELLRFLSNPDHLVIFGFIRYLCLYVEAFFRREGKLGFHKLADYNLSFLRQRRFLVTFHGRARTLSLDI